MNGESTTEKKPAGSGSLLALVSRITAAALCLYTIIAITWFAVLVIPSDGSPFATITLGIVVGLASQVGIFLAPSMLDRTRLPRLSVALSMLPSLLFLLNETVTLVGHWFYWPAPRFLQTFVILW